MKNDAAKLKVFLFLLLTGFLSVAAASGYLYNQKKNYQYENQRLIIVNDSILSENLELKNALQLNKSSAVLKVTSGNIKKGASK